MEQNATPFELLPLGECVEILDSLRRPINADERRHRQGNVPYYGANGQVGWIDDWIFEDELVLVAEDGGFFEDPGRPISYRIGGKAWVNNHAHVLRPLQGIDVDWLNYAIAFQDVCHLLNGATLKKLNQRNLLKVPIPKPNVDEQRRLVARIKECMERVEEIERLRAEALMEAEAALPSTLSEIFDQLGARYGSTTIGDVATETRYGTSQKCDKRAEGVPILRIPNVAAGVIDYRDLKYCSLDRSELERIRLVAGDLLFVRTNGSRDLVGRCAVYRPRGSDDEFGFASYLIRVRLDTDLADPDYLKFFLNSTHGRDEIDRRRRTSAGQFNVNSENLRSISFPCPPKETQLAVIEQLAEQESRLVQLQAEIASAQAIESGLREAILRKAFAGEL